MEAADLAEYARLLALYNAAVAGLTEAYAVAKQLSASAGETKAKLDAFLADAGLGAVPQPDEITGIQTDLEGQ